MTRAALVWIPSPAALAAAEAARGSYEPGPPWEGGANCSGGHRPGTRALGRALAARFPGIIDHTAGYDCRPNTAGRATTSLHGTGRALDLMLKGERPNPEGDLVAAFLLERAQALGIIEVIWNRAIWSSSQGYHAYTGPVPHVDHIHVGLRSRTAEGLTAETIAAIFDAPGGGGEGGSSSSRAGWVLVVALLAAGAVSALAYEALGGGKRGRR